MISNQILQNTIEGLKAITRIDLCIVDTEGKPLATTFAGAEVYENAVLAFVESPAAVSYTHLDVYKRQGIWLYPKLSPSWGAL